MKRQLTILLIALFTVVLLLCATGCTGSSSSSGGSRSSFTNQYGTPTTKCAHAGCNNYIASSGDTNCCTTHSRRCLECGKYIDEDATYCMDCIRKAVTGR